MLDNCKQGVGEKIAERDIPKIFLLNGSHDRETSASKSSAGPMTACDVVLAVCDALNRRHAKVCPLAWPFVDTGPWHLLSGHSKHGGAEEAAPANWTEHSSPRTLVRNLM